MSVEFHIKYTWDDNRGQGSEEHAVKTVEEALSWLHRPQRQGTERETTWRAELLAGEPVSASVTYGYGTAAGGGSTVTVTPPSLSLKEYDIRLAQAVVDAPPFRDVPMPEQAYQIEKYLRPFLGSERQLRAMNRGQECAEDVLVMRNDPRNRAGQIAHWLRRQGVAPDDVEPGLLREALSAP